jgi:uncharacterized membrane protein YgcG
MHRLGRSLIALFGLIAATALAFFPAQAAFAEQPMQVDSVVTDTTNTLSNQDIDAIEQASSDLESATGSTLYYVMVDSFENPSDGNDWATAVALESQLGTDDIVLYVGLDEQDFGLNVDGDLPLSSSDRQSIQEDLSPYLNQSDYVGAAQQAAMGLETALNGSYSGGSSSGGGSSSASGTSAFTIALGIIVLIVLIVVGVLFFVNRRKRTKSLREAEAQQAAELEARLQQASIQLVRMDNLIRSSEEEMAFASAQFGSDEVKVYRDEVEMAKRASKEAFELQGKLLDHIPDAPEDREAWIDRILSITEIATKRLGDQAHHFQDLRVRQDQAPQLLAAVRQHYDESKSRLADAQTWFDGLGDAYDQAALDRIKVDLTQAGQLLELTEDEIEGATESLESGNPGAAIIDISDAENAIAQYDGLVKRLAETRSLYDRAPKQITDQAATLRRTVAQVQQVAATTGNDAKPQVAEIVAEATKILGAIDSANGRFGDPEATIERLHDAASRVDTQLTQLLGEKERIDHAKSRLQESAQSAYSEIAAATSFIASKRGALSSSPRTRLDQAESQVARADALRAGDPVQALQHYNEAGNLARAALQTAQQELETAYSYGDSWGASSWQTGYGSHRHSSRSGGSDFLTSMGGAIIGGIIGGILNDSGSSRRHNNDWSGFGGFGGGGGGGFGGFGGGGGGSRGGFGGGGGGTR